MRRVHVIVVDELGREQFDWETLRGAAVRARALVSVYVVGQRLRTILQATDARKSPESLPDLGERSASTHAAVQELGTEIYVTHHTLAVAKPAHIGLIMLTDKASTGGLVDGLRQESWITVIRELDARQSGSADSLKPASAPKTAHVRQPRSRTSKHVAPNVQPPAHAPQRRRGWWTRNQAARAANIQALALIVLVAAVFVERSQDLRAGMLLDGAFPETGIDIGPFLTLRPDWTALVLGTVAALTLREEAGRRTRIELAALLGATGGVMYVGTSVEHVISTFEPDVFALGAILYGIATVANVLTFVDAWIGRTVRERAGPGASSWFRNADRQTVQRTLVATLTGVLPALIGWAMIASGLDGEPPEGSFRYLALAAPQHVALASLLMGLWAPLAVGTLLLVLRGNWGLRPFGTGVAAVFAMSAVVAFVYGGPQSEQAMERATQAFLTTPISPDAVDGGFCGRVWTGTQAPTRAAVTGPECREVRRYHGWHLMWTYTLPERPDDFLSIDGMYLLLWNDGQELVALDGATGEPAWERSCHDDWMWIDYSQLDQAENTPSNQRVIGSCGDTEFDVDPMTGE